MDLLSVPKANPNLPPKVKEAREMLQYAAIFFLLAALLYFLWGFWDIMRGLFWSAWWFSGYYGTWRIGYGITRIVFAVIALILKGKLVEDIITPVDNGQYRNIEDKMVIYIVLGFIFGLVISGILILLGYMKLKEVGDQANACPTCRAPVRFVPEYQRWYCDNCKDYKVPIHPGSASPPHSQQPPPPDDVENTCPDCNNSTRHIPQYDRHYCDNCGKYV